MVRRINYISPRVNTNDRSVGLSPPSGEKPKAEGVHFHSRRLVVWFSKGKAVKRERLDYRKKRSPLEKGRDEGQG